VDRSRLEARRREHRGVASQREITVFMIDLYIQILIFFLLFIFLIFFEAEHREALAASGIFSLSLSACLCVFRVYQDTLLQGKKEELIACSLQREV
jgi:hypothetical protein